jgi:hypothetical protein
MSGVYIGVGGKARKVKGGYIGVDGKARKIKKGYIGDENGVARLCWSGFDPVFANNTWEEIAAACQTRQVPDTWAVGDQKAMTIGGVDYAIDIIGMNHDDYSDGSGKAPLPFQLHDICSEEMMNSVATNDGGWSVTPMRNNTMPIILGGMPVNIKDKIREVNKLSCLGGYSTTLKTTVDKLFLLSEIEVYGTTTYSRVAEGKQYKYYADGGSKVKNIGGSFKYWWLRTPNANGPDDFCIVINDSTISNSNAINRYGVSFAFCF